MRSTDLMTKTIPFDLDTPIDRRGSGCAKWGYYDDDVLPLWVADMDFKAPPAVLDALRERVDHGIFGYTPPPSGLAALLVERMAKLYGWHIQPEDIVYIPGVIPGINLTARATLTLIANQMTHDEHSILVNVYGRWMDTAPPKSWSASGRACKTG